MIYLLDDFHNVQTVRLPGTNMKLSFATHMASYICWTFTKVYLLFFFLPTSQKFIELLQSTAKVKTSNVEEELIPTIFPNF